MKVTLGYSQEHRDGKWSKMDITLEEEDIRRLLVENGMEPDATIKASDAFKLLNSEAMIYITAKTLSVGLIDKEQASAEIKQHENFKSALLAKIKEAASD